MPPSGLERQFSRQFDDDVPGVVDVVCFSARGTDGKAQEVASLALRRNNVDPTVIVDLIKQLFVQLITTLSTQS